MKDINKIIDSLSPGEQNVMYNALQKYVITNPNFRSILDEIDYGNIRRTKKYI